MGFCHYSMGQYGQAIENFQAALRLDPSSAIDYANIASNYRKLGENKKAIHYYETALALDPSIDFAKAHLNDLQKQGGGL
jgi:ribosomal protein S12 methylthiotransferase accessory factor